MTYGTHARTHVVNDVNASTFDYCGQVAHCSTISFVTKRGRGCGKSP
jgi:hypothetical protein